MTLEIVTGKPNLGEIMESDDVGRLSELANVALTQGATLTALAYMAAYRISQIYRKVEESSPEALKQALVDRKKLLLDQKIGATALRRYYCEELFGWSSFDAWANDFSSGAPVSRSSLWAKVRDIEAWREEGCEWDTVLRLLTSVPMAAREAIEKPVAPEALPPGPDGTPSKAQYLRELSEMPPGQARVKVSVDAGEPSIYVSEAKLAWTARYGKALLMMVVVETSDGFERHDIVIHPVEQGEGWGAVALWISEKLGSRIRVSDGVP